MPNHSNVTVRSFFIFNSLFGPKEGEEEEKILYYYPKELDIDTKIKDVGFCEAIIKFTNTFTANNDKIDCVQTQKTLQLFYQPEKEYWVVLTLAVPFETRTKDGKEYNEYRGDTVHERVYQMLLKQIYASFRLLNGSFESIYTNYRCDRLSLMLCLESFFDRYLENFNLQNTGFYNVINSVHYLPVNQEQFFTIQTFISLVEATFEDQIENSVFLFNNRVVWSSLSPQNLYTFYDYLTDEVFPKLYLSGLQGDLANSFHPSQYGTFIVGPPFLNCVIEPQFIYLNEHDVEKTYELIIYKVLNCMICLFLAHDSKEARSDAVQPNFFDELSTLMGPQMSNISTELQEFQTALAKDTKDSDTQQRYLFFNELSLKVDGTIRKRGEEDAKSLSTEIMNIMTDIYNTRKGKSNSQEAIVKTHNDFWIVCKSSNYRHYFLILNKSHSTLIDISEEAKKISDQHIRNMFFIH